MLKQILAIVILLMSCDSDSQASSQDVDLKTKIGQMLLIGFKGTELHRNDTITQDILAQRLGGVILYEYDNKTKQHGRNIISPNQLKSLTNQLQTYANQAAKTHRNQLLPLLIALDYEGGKVQRLSTKNGFSPTLSAEEIAKHSSAEAAIEANKMAQTLKEVGVNLNFAPDVDVNTNSQSPIIAKLGRSFSNDPMIVTQYAKIFSTAYLNHQVLCSYKHFPGHGSATGDTHKGFVDVTATWNESELIPFAQLINDSSSCPLIMIAHVINKKLDKTSSPASLSYPIITKKLRGEMHFSGVVISDDLQMGAISTLYPNFNEVLIQAINAGNDILIIANQLGNQKTQEVVNMIYDDVRSGKISKKQIDMAYQRIMHLKSLLRNHHGT